MPWLVPLVTTAYSVYSSANAASKAKKAERQLEGMQPPTYRPNQSILNYYDEALRRYNVAPTETAQYKVDKQNIEQGVIQGLKAAQDRRGAMATIPSLMLGRNRSLLQSAVNAENRKARDFSVLGQATGMKAGEGMKEFQYNQLAPFEKNYNLLAMKAAGERANQRLASQNTYNNAYALSSIFQDNWDQGYNIFGTQKRKR